MPNSQRYLKSKYKLDIMFTILNLILWFLYKSDLSILGIITIAQICKEKNDNISNKIYHRRVQGYCCEFDLAIFTSVTWNYTNSRT